MIRTFFISSLFFANWALLPLVAGDETKAKADAAVAAVNQEPEILVLDEAGSFAHKEALLAAVTRYWELHQMSDFATQYEMFLPAYKAEISLTDYLKKKRGVVDEYTIHRMRFWGDTCAQVEFRLSMQAEVMQLNSVPMRQVWKWVDGEWLVYENPRSISMVPRSFGKKKKVEKPCPLPAEWQTEKPKAAKDKKPSR